jgi:hypothetical protein
MQRARRLAPWLLLAAFAASGMLLGSTWVLALAPLVALLVPLLAGRYLGEDVLARWARRAPAGRPRARMRLRAPRLRWIVAAPFAAAAAPRGPPVLS